MREVKTPWEYHVSQGRWMDEVMEREKYSVGLDCVMVSLWSLAGVAWALTGVPTATHGCVFRVISKASLVSEVAGGVCSKYFVEN
jgi:hypothetical protein